MRTLLSILMLAICLTIPSVLRAQVVDATVCDILSNPQSFDGKMVRVKGIVIAGFEEFAIKGSGCNQMVDAVWLDYPEGTKGKAGPVALLQLQLAKNNPAAVSIVSRAPVTLDKNKDFKDFDNFLSTPSKTNGLCMGCVKNNVTATLVGRLDGTKDTGLIRDGSGRVIGVSGFGHLNRYNARLVLQSVSEISPMEIDYAKGGAAVSGEAAPAGGSFTPGTPTVEQLKQSAEAWGAPGDDNGVMVGFGGANEIPKNDTAKSSANSPDGLILSAVYDGERLKGPAMQVAMSHLGMHIADIRSPAVGIRSLILYGAEFRALQISLLSAASAKVKTLTLPGGYVIYDKSWSDSGLGKNANKGIAGFLSNWASISNPPKP